MIHQVPDIIDTGAFFSQKKARYFKLRAYRVKSSPGKNCFQ